MPDYPTDLDLNRNKDIHLDGANDLALTSGIEQLQQSTAIDVFDELQQFIGGRLNGENLGLLEERIRQGLNDDPQLSTVRNVNVMEYDRGTESITVSVEVVDNENFTLEL